MEVDATGETLSDLGRRYHSNRHILQRLTHSLNSIEIFCQPYRSNGYTLKESWHHNIPRESDNSVVTVCIGDCLCYCLRSSVLRTVDVAFTELKICFTNGVGINALINPATDKNSVSVITAGSAPITA